MTRVGGLVLPAIPQVDRLAHGADPTVEVLLSFFTKVLEVQVGALWQSLTKEPVVRRAVAHDPERVDFSGALTPLLAVYRMNDAMAFQLTGDLRNTTGRICILWVLPRLPQMKDASVDPFFNAWKKAIESAVNDQRLREWVHPDDLQDESAKFWGSSVLQKARIDDWSMPDGASRVPIKIEVMGGAPFETDGYRAILMIEESASSADNPAWQQYPTIIDDRLQSEEPDPADRITRQHYVVPVGPLPEDSP